jgi:hypothetical protein
MPAEGMKSEELGLRKILAYDGLQGLLEGVALGIEERQLEMKEMIKNMSIRQEELMELEKTIRRRQMLLDLTPREVEESVYKLEVVKKMMEEERIWSEEPANCTEMIIIPESQTRKESRISELKVMGMFILCSLLACLGWGGVTSTLIIASKAWPSRRPSSNMDVSTSKGELRPGENAAASSLPR